MNAIDRRVFLKRTTIASTLPLVAAVTGGQAATEAHEVDWQFGLVTYLWGKDMALPELVGACEESQLLGVELRTEHRHGVEPALSATD